MAINSYFFNAVLNDGVYDRTYNAEDVTNYLQGIVGDGVLPNPSMNLQVVPYSGMQIMVEAGAGYIQGHKLVNTSGYVLAISASDVFLPRIDAVVFYVDFDNRTMGISVKKGTLAASPVAPTLQQDNSKWEMCLAQISVPKQTTRITTDLITDTRGNSSLCGYVQGLIQQIDTTTLWEQQQKMFLDWFSAIKGQFQAGNIFHKYEGIRVTQVDGVDTFNITDYVPNYKFAYDILEIYINGIHLTGNEYTLTNNIVTLEKPIEKAGAVVDFVVYQLVTYQQP